MIGDRDVNQDEPTVYLQTLRVVLRRMVESDAADIFELDCDPEVIRFLHHDPPTSVQEVRTGSLARFMGFYDRYDDLGFWAAVDKPSGEFIGWFHLRPFNDRTDVLNLGYRLKRSHWGRGLATEVSAALLKKAFDELGAKQIVAKALAANAASIRVMQKLGMRYVESFTEAGQPAVTYAITNPLP